LERIRSAALTQATRNEEEADLIRLLYILTYDDPDQQGKLVIEHDFIRVISILLGLTVRNKHTTSPQRLLRFYNAVLQWKF